MNISEYSDIKKLQDMQDKFAASVGVAAILLDATGAPVTGESYPMGLQVNTAKMEKREALFRGNVLAEKKELKVEGEIIGSVALGTVSPSRHEVALKQVASAMGKDGEAYVASLPAMEEKSPEQLRAACDLFASIVEEMAGNVQREAAIFEEMVPQVEHLTTAIREISQSAKKLEGIAFKQNILALNASIEAARAGDIGKGFAVVAQEMGNMTKNSSEIYGGIEDKVKELEEVIGQMNQKKQSKAEPK